MGRVGWLLMGIILGGGAGQGAGPPSPEAMLRAVFLSEEQVSYVGVQVSQSYRFDRPFTVRSRIWRRIPGWERIEYLEPAHMAGQWSIRNGESYARYLPFGKRTLFLHSLPSRQKIREERERRWRLIRANFQLLRTGQENIVGRPAWIVEIHPRRTPRQLAHKLWVDQEHLFPLRKEMYAADGRLYSLTYFVEIEFRPVEEGLFQIEAPTGARVVRGLGEGPRFEEPHQVPASLRPLLLLPRQLPAGYRLERIEVRGKPRERLVVSYTDGLHALLLTIARVPAEMQRKMRDEMRRRAPEHARLRMVRDRVAFAFSPYLPGEELDRVLDSLQPYVAGPAPQH